MSHELRPTSLDALTFPGATDASILRGIHNTEYSAILRSYIMLGGSVVYDPDVALESDPDAYRKMVAEISIASKLQKRARRATSSGWQIHSTDVRFQGVCDLLEHILESASGFRTSLYTLLYKTILSGFGCARIHGDFSWRTFPGTFGPGVWWVPSKLNDVDKQRWRLHKEDPVNTAVGMPLWFWAIQDTLNYDWHRIDLPDAPSGLRRRDYIWAKSAEDEMDLGYGHGLARSLLHKWFMSTHAWMYAIDGAETWAKGKTVVKTPKTIGGTTIPGDSGLSDSIRRQAVERQKLADTFSQSLSRHVVVIDSDQEVEVLSRPNSGHESVKWIIENIEDDYSEMILGINPKLQMSRNIDIDPDIIESDQQLLETAINEDLIPNIVDYNAPRFQELGWDCEEIKANCRFVMARRNGMTPEQIGKNIQIVLAAGAPVHRADIYGLTGLRPVSPGSPDAIFQPQAGQPVSMRPAGEGRSDWTPGADGGPQEKTSAPSPGGAPIPQVNKGGFQQG